MCPDFSENHYCSKQKMNRFDKSGMVALECFQLLSWHNNISVPLNRLEMLKSKKYTESNEKIVRNI